LNHYLVRDSDSLPKPPNNAQHQVLVRVNASGGAIALAVKDFPVPESPPTSNHADEVDRMPLRIPLNAPPRLNSQSLRLSDRQGDSFTCGVKSRIVWPTNGFGFFLLAQVPRLLVAVRRGCDRSC